MSDPIQVMIFDLVAWVAKEVRAYTDVMDAWRTSCPRLPVWEEANARGLVTRTRGSNGVPIMRATGAGRALVAAQP